MAFQIQDMSPDVVAYVMCFGRTPWTLGFTATVFFRAGATKHSARPQTFSRFYFDRLLRAINLPSQHQQQY
jgi:hypothetical protein